MFLLSKLSKHINFFVPFPSDVWPSILIFDLRVVKGRSVSPALLGVNFVELGVVFYVKPRNTSRSPKSEWHDGPRRLVTGNVY